MRAKPREVNQYMYRTVSEWVSEYVLYLLIKEDGKTTFTLLCPSSWGLGPVWRTNKRSIGYLINKNDEDSLARLNSYIESVASSTQALLAHT